MKLRDLDNYIFSVILSNLNQADMLNFRLACFRFNCLFYEWLQNNTLYIKDEEPNRCDFLERVFDFMLYNLSDSIRDRQSTNGFNILEDLLDECKFIDFSNCDYITDKHLRYLSNCVKINFTYCREITDEGLKYLSNCRSINLTGYKYITESIEDARRYQLKDCSI